jgi:CyaY protein
VSAFNEQDYDELALPELQAVLAALDELGDELEAELQSDILTVEFGDGMCWVLNSHRAARQLWLAADRHAWHFSWNREKLAWTADKSGEELWSTLERILGQKLGRSVKLTSNPLK